MKPTFVALVIALAGMLALASSEVVRAQKAGIVIPPSGKNAPGDIGRRAHTLLQINLNKPGIGKRMGGIGNPPAGYAPHDLWAAYNIPASGGGGAGGAIAIVDAYHYPTALYDFNVYSATYGLPTEPSPDPTASTNHVFQVVYANGRPSPNSTGWNVEEALDIEMAHAMAPYAKVYLVEARSSSLHDLFNAVHRATGLPGVRQIAISWGNGEFKDERLYDLYFQTPGIVFVASSGDGGSGAGYPSSSPYVLAAGGTSLYLDADDHYLDETAWGGSAAPGSYYGSGGGPSAYEPTPNYQINAGLLNTFIDPSGANTQFVGRGVPDVSLVADPNTGVAVFTSSPLAFITPNPGYWIVVGGTSLSAPALAGIINNNASFYGPFGSTAAELNHIYSLYNSADYGASYHDVSHGNTGYFNAAPGWDFTTGVGTPLSFGSL